MSQFIEVTLKGGKRMINTAGIVYITASKEGTGSFLSLDGTSQVGVPNLQVAESYEYLKELLFPSRPTLTA